MTASIEIVFIVKIFLKIYTFRPAKTHRVNFEWNVPLKQQWKPK